MSTRLEPLPDITVENGTIKVADKTPINKHLEEDEIQQMSEIDISGYPLTKCINSNVTATSFIVPVILMFFGLPLMCLLTDGSVTINGVYYDHMNFNVLMSLWPFLLIGGFGALLFTKNVFIGILCSAFGEEMYGTVAKSENTNVRINGVPVKRLYIIIEKVPDKEVICVTARKYLSIGSRIKIKKFLNMAKIQNGKSVENKFLKHDKHLRIFSLP